MIISVCEVYCPNCEKNFVVKEDRIVNGGNNSEYFTACSNCGFGINLSTVYVENNFGKIDLVKQPKYSIKLNCKNCEHRSFIKPNEICFEKSDSLFYFVCKKCKFSNLINCNTAINTLHNKEYLDYVFKDYIFDPIYKLLEQYQIHPKVSEYDLTIIMKYHEHFKKNIEERVIEIINGSEKVKVEKISENTYYLFITESDKIDFKKTKDEKYITFKIFFE